MNDCHSNTMPNSRPTGSVWRSAAGFAALLLGLFLSASGVEIARADPAPKAETPGYVNGEAVATPVPSPVAPTSCEAGSTQAQVVANVEAARKQAARAVARHASDASARRTRVIPLNGRGYNYAPGHMPREPRAR
jgi:hypothetical protein